MTNIELLEQILNRPENLCGVDIKTIRIEFAKNGFAKADMQFAKKEIGAVTSGYPASEDGLRQEKWLWMKR